MKTTTSSATTHSAVIAWGQQATARINALFAGIDRAVYHLQAIDDTLASYPRFAR